MKDFAKLFNTEYGQVLVFMCQQYLDPGYDVKIIFMHSGKQIDLTINDFVHLGLTVNGPQDIFSHIDTELCIGIIAQAISEIDGNEKESKI